MWMFKSISGKDQAGLEGRVIEIGNIKIRLQNAIAEGGFSCVYLAHDAVNPSNHYALKHMICQDAESLDLALKEIQVMKALKGHSNVVTLVAHSILDVGRRKEALLLMEFCEKSLVNTLEIRGAGYFEEKQVLLIFRDICNAVFAMHSHSPPIAHRDLKAENVLLGSDGAWKLCDFGSTSTNHKCFDRPEEMGIEEDNIRKHTTPAYRAPEMWDLYKREVISEKVDIWALGCLLYRICYFKLAFDGESKLQILNGNYRIPELPKYSADVTRLIKEMLEGSPDSRPDITQVWFRVNELLPVELQKHLPDGAEVASTVNTHPPILDVHDGGALNRNHVRPKRSPPPPPSLVEKTGEELKTRVSHGLPTVASSEDGLGAFWSTQFAQDSQVVEGKGRLIDEEPMHRASKHSHADLERRTSSSVERRARTTKASVCRGVEDGQTENLGTGFSLENTSNFQNQPFTPFVTDFDSIKPDSTKAFISKREQELEAEVKKLKEQLKQVNLEKTEVTSKFEKLSVICRSQRQEIQELKLAQATSTPPSEKESSKSHVFFSGTLSKEKNEGSVSDSQKEMLSFKTSSSPDPKSWQAFADEPKQQLMPNAKHSKSVRTNNNLFNSTKKPGSIPASDDWGFHQLSFTASPPSSSETFRSPVPGSSSQRFAASNVKKVESSQPGGWAGF